MFHADIARHLGIDLAKCSTETANGIGGEESVPLHDIRLFIPGGPVVTCASFKENLPVAGLLGMTGFFEHFRVTFDCVSQACELERIFKA